MATQPAMDLSLWLLELSLPQLWAEDHLRPSRVPLRFPRSEIEDVRTDQLHLDIWYRGCGRLRSEGSGRGQGQAGLQTSQVPPTPPRDHDDDVSLVDACRKLNEVIGLKGMSRYSTWDPAQLVMVAPGGSQV